MLTGISPISLRSSRGFWPFSISNTPAWVWRGALLSRAPSCMRSRRADMAFWHHQLWQPLLGGPPGIGLWLEAIAVAARPECAGNTADLVTTATPSAAPRTWCGRSCSMWMEDLGGCVSAGVFTYLAHSSCANLGVCTQICMGSCVHICVFMSICVGLHISVRSHLGMLALA